MLAPIKTIVLIVKAAGYRKFDEIFIFLNNNNIKGMKRKNTDANRKYSIVFVLFLFRLSAANIFLTVNIFNALFPRH